MRSAYSSLEWMPKQEIMMNATQHPSKSTHKTEKTVRPVPKLLSELTYVLHLTKVIGRIPESLLATRTPRKSR
jgi:hypothetical protein